MGRRNHHDSVQKKSVSAIQYPQIFVDQEADFASIKLSYGIEAKSYLKDGFVFCEDKKGNILEIQILNLTQLKSSTKQKLRKIRPTRKTKIRTTKSRAAI